MNICVLIPANNEAAALGNILKQLKTLGLHTVVIDDGSQDDTASIAEKEGVFVLRNKVNQGKGDALVKGFKHVLEQDYEAIITLDGDGQHLPQETAAFLRQYEQSKAPLIIGNRLHNPGNMPLVRKLTNIFISWLISFIAWQHIPDSQCGFRLISRKLLETLTFHADNYELETEIIIQAARLGHRVASVPIASVYNGEKSHIRPFYDTVRFIRYILRTI